jgi:hypothetical protein
MPYGAERAGKLAGDMITSSRAVEKALLSIGAGASFWIFWSVASLFALPRFRDYQASLLVQPSPLLALLMAGVVLLACVVLTSLFTGSVEFEAGLFCGAIGLFALSARGGPMRYVLMYSPGNGVFARLIFETLTLFAFVGVAWATVGFLRDRGLLHEKYADEPDAPDALPAQGVMALAAQVVIIILILALLAHTDKKAQVVWSLAVATPIAALAAHSLFPARPSIWFWSAPLVVALIGYTLAYAGGGNHLPGGNIGGYAPALARPLPLDYASIGTAGSLFGYWTSRRWQHEKDEDPDEPAEVEDRLEHPPVA